MSQLSAYRVPPQMERKAAAELRQAGIKAYLPRDRNHPRRPPMAPGYVFSRYKPAFAKHVANRIGGLVSSELGNLYAHRAQAAVVVEIKLSVGDDVSVKDGMFAGQLGKLVEKRGRRQWLVELKSGRVCLQSTSLIRIDPG